VLQLLALAAQVVVELVVQEIQLHGHMQLLVLLTQAVGEAVAHEKTLMPLEVVTAALVS
jgi:hypothetical protein